VTSSIRLRPGSESDEDPVARRTAATIKNSIVGLHEAGLNINDAATFTVAQNGGIVLENMIFNNNPDPPTTRVRGPSLPSSSPSEPEHRGERLHAEGALRPDVARLPAASDYPYRRVAVSSPNDGFRAGAVPRRIRTRGSEPRRSYLGTVWVDELHRTRSDEISIDGPRSRLCFSAAAAMAACEAAGANSADFDVRIPGGAGPDGPRGGVEGRRSTLKSLLDGRSASPSGPSFRSRPGGAAGVRLGGAKPEEPNAIATEYACHKGRRLGFPIRFKDGRRLRELHRSSKGSPGVRS
jgi:hypothetical protein